MTNAPFHYFIIFSAFMCQGFFWKYPAIKQAFVGGSPVFNKIGPFQFDPLFPLLCTMSHNVPPDIQNPTVCSANALFIDVVYLYFAQILEPGGELHGCTPGFQDAVVLSLGIQKPMGCLFCFRLSCNYC